MAYNIVLSRMFYLHGFSEAQCYFRNCCDSRKCFFLVSVESVRLRIRSVIPVDASQFHIFSREQGISCLLRETFEILHDLHSSGSSCAFPPPQRPFTSFQEISSVIEDFSFPHLRNSLFGVGRSAPRIKEDKPHVPSRTRFNIYYSGLIAK